MEKRKFYKSEYKKINIEGEKEWNIEDDSEFVKIFRFEMEEQIKRDPKSVFEINEFKK